MANSRYEYVKSFEVHDKLLPSTWIVIRIDGCHFHRFSDVHEFEKPNDENALKMMNSCALAMFEEFPDIVFAYGVSDEYSFVLKKSSKFYERRSSGKTISQRSHCSVHLILMGESYVIHHKKFFEIIFLGGKSIGTQASEKNELLFQKFGINYDKLPAIFRKGSCIFREMVDEIVKYDEAATPIRRPRKRVVLDHCDIIGPKFWNEHPTILLDK